jgi:hypothetical protein
MLNALSGSLWLVLLSRFDGGELSDGSEDVTLPYEGELPPPLTLSLSFPTEFLTPSTGGTSEDSIALY